MDRRASIVGGLGGIAFGISISYFLDPLNGRRRRARVKDKVNHFTHTFSRMVNIAARDVAHRARGMFYETKAKLSEHEVEDRVLAERVRAELGRVCSHPGAIEVKATHGVVELKGPILKSEVRHALARISRVRGVHEIAQDLQEYATPSDVPGLQGGAGRRMDLPELLQRNWAPAIRLLVGATGLWVFSRSLTQRNAAHIATGLFGAGLVARSATNIELKRLFGIGAGRRAIEIVKDMEVRAPVEDVFALWAAPENFPRFMGHVKEVRRVSDKAYHWIVQGPLGMSFSWDAEVSGFEPNHLLAWKTVPGSMVASSGLTRFERVGPNTTHMKVRMSYNPPAGAIGHAFAKLVGADPKKQMDEDLIRFKSLVETGRATGRETVTREELHVEPYHTTH